MKNKDFVCIWLYNLTPFISKKSAIKCRYKGQEAITVDRVI